MARTIVYPPRTRDAGVLAGAGDSSDNITTKIAKYIPGEVIGPILPLLTLAEKQTDSQLWLVICLVAGLIATPIYLWVSAPNVPEEKPRWFFYVLGPIAFIAWAIGTRGAIATLLGFDLNAGSIILAIAVFLIPLIDHFLTKLEL